MTSQMAVNISWSEKQLMQLSQPHQTHDAIDDMQLLKPLLNNKNTGIPTLLAYVFLKCDHHLMQLLANQRYII